MKSTQVSHGRHEAQHRKDFSMRDRPMDLLPMLVFFIFSEGALMAWLIVEYFFFIGNRFILSHA
jgi:hypothetical protein